MHCHIFYFIFATGHYFPYLIFVLQLLFLYILLAENYFSIKIVLVNRNHGSNTIIICLRETEIDTNLGFYKFDNDVYLKSTFTRYMIKTIFSFIAQSDLTVSNQSFNNHAGFTDYVPVAIAPWSILFLLMPYFNLFHLISYFNTGLNPNSNLTLKLTLNLSFKSNQNSYSHTSVAPRNRLQTDSKPTDSWPWTKIM